MACDGELRSRLKQQKARSFQPSQTTISTIFHKSHWRPPELHPTKRPIGISCLAWELPTSSRKEMAHLRPCSVVGSASTMTWPQAQREIWSRMHILIRGTPSTTAANFRSYTRPRTEPSRLTLPLQHHLPFWLRVPRTAAFCSDSIRTFKHLTRLSGMWPCSRKLANSKL